MNLPRCPNCSINLTPEESKGARCPLCGSALKGLHTATPTSFTAPAETAPPAEPVTPSSQLPRVDTSRGRRSTSASGKSGWWVWILVVLALKGAYFASRGFNYTRSRSSYTAPSYPGRSYDNPTYGGGYDGAYNRPVAPAASPYIDTNNGYTPPSVPTSQPYSRPSPWDGRATSPNYGPGSAPTWRPGGSSIPSRPSPSIPRPSIPRPSIPSPNIPRPGGF